MTMEILASSSQDSGDDPASLREQADNAARSGRDEDAVALLERAVALAPERLVLRFDLAWALHRLNRPAEAIAHLSPVIEAEPDNESLARLRAALLERAGRYDEAVAAFESLTRIGPDRPEAWNGLAHVLRTVGRTEDSIAAYRRAIALKPRSGEAWWGLANVKAERLTEDDVAAIEAALAHDYVTHDDAVKLHFALGKALEDKGDDEAAFREYGRGNALRREDIGYDPGEITQHVDRAEALFTRDFFAARSDHGSPTAGPIFIIGLPRSGSTLVEQILASHPDVEGTAELPDLLSIARRLRLGGEIRGRAYPDGLADLNAADCAALGEEYLARTRFRRSSDRPYFIDKTPNNWAHVGLIQLILPNARIVDVRRHPLSCGVANFRQYFAEGQEFTYSLPDLGRYYRDYVRLLRHVDDVLPGRVVRVIYETLVEDLEGEARRLLDALGLDFHPGVLRFHETERAVHTPSAEQVRRPINREGIDNWQRFDPWLAPLRKALGPALSLYPEAP